MRAAVSAGIIALAISFSSLSLMAQEANRPVFEERAPCAAVDAACEQMAEIRAEAERGVPWGILPGKVASLFRFDSVLGFASRETSGQPAGVSRAEIRRVLDVVNERRVIRLEWRYSRSLEGGRTAAEYAEAVIDSASGAWLDARWAVDDPAGRFPLLPGRTGTAACVSWARSGDIRVLVGGKLARSYAPPAGSETKWLPWPVAVLSLLASGDGAPYSLPFIAPFWSSAETVSSVVTADIRDRDVRWSTSLGDWYARRKQGEEEFILSGSLWAGGGGEEMEMKKHDGFRSNILAALTASCK